MTMNTIKLTSNDIRLMVNEAVKRTLKEKMDWNRFGKNPTWSPTVPHWSDSSEKEPEPYDSKQVEASVAEEIEDFKYIMILLSDKAKELLNWASKKGLNPVVIKNRFNEFVQSGKNQKVDNIEEVINYLEIKSKETNKRPWDVAIDFCKMPEEEQTAEARKYASNSIIDRYKTDYSDYVRGYGESLRTRNEKISKIKQFVDEYSNVRVEDMSFVEICETLDKIDGLKSEDDKKVNSYQNSRLKQGHGNESDFFEKYGLKGLERRLKNEKERREAKAPHFSGTNNDFDWKNFSKIEAMGKKYRTYGSSQSERERGNDWSSGYIVDDNGNLLCVYDKRIDSSD